ncbi:MAG: 50S ribosomal protein L24 [Desulfotomaculum sp.]|nr:50S ribosomal protein L24 [Desulfotomaculum sp.]MCL0101160.1 50S ribosomal protein L24 [Peptococcaceae bacterium]MCL0107788.1 50S ribosomal protein L24 [Peptococcaceae bacterium]
MHKMHVRKGDIVVVITGKDAGKKGKILEAQPKKNRVVVEGVNIVKRHMKPTRAVPQGGIIEKPAPIHVSNVMLFCSKCNRPVRVGKKILPDGKKERVCKKCGAVI